MFAFWRRLQRRQLLESPFPDEYRELLRRNVPLYAGLEQADRDKLEGLVRILIAEKNFAGAGGLELDEEMCVAIAGRACLLVLHRVGLDDPLYPDLGSILVYPDTYRAQVRHVDGYVVREGEQTRLGESWQHGTLVLSWRAALAGSANQHDGHDVVLHEFAHQLDGEEGEMNGAPELDSAAHYRSWASTFSHEFELLQATLRRGGISDIDSYAATNPAEFFAVVTEEFFEQSARLSQKHPALYAELCDYYRLDPLALGRG